MSMDMQGKLTAAVGVTVASMFTAGAVYYGLVAEPPAQRKQTKSKKKKKKQTSGPVTLPVLLEFSKKFNEALDRSIAAIAKEEHRIRMNMQLQRRPIPAGELKKYLKDKFAEMLKKEEAALYEEFSNSAIAFQKAAKLYANEAEYQKETDKARASFEKMQESWVPEKEPTIEDMIKLLGEISEMQMKVARSQIKKKQPGEPKMTEQEIRVITLRMSQVIQRGLLEVLKKNKMDMTSFQAMVQKYQSEPAFYNVFKQSEDRFAALFKELNCPELATARMMG